MDFDPEMGLYVFAANLNTTNGYEIVINTPTHETVKAYLLVCSSQQYACVCIHAHMFACLYVRVHTHTTYKHTFTYTHVYVCVLKSTEGNIGLKAVA